MASDTFDTPADVVAWLASPVGNQALLACAEQLPISPNEILRLRETYGLTRSKWLLEFAEQLFAASNKLNVPNALATRLALQQSTDHWLASYKSQQFPANVAVYDVCAGVGGDSLALATRGPVIALDRDPLLCACLQYNATQCGRNSLQVVCGPAEECSLPPDACLHIDPDRRVDAKRQVDPNCYSPSIPTVNRLLQQSVFAAVKLAPAAQIPDSWRDQMKRLEWISRDGECRQQVAWFEPEAVTDNLRQATRIERDGSSSVLSATQEAYTSCRAAITDDVGSWLIDWDPAIRAAHLSDFAGIQLNATAVGDASGFFTIDHLPVAIPSWRKLFSLFRVEWCGPLDRKQIRRILQENPPHALEIKVRGADVLPEALRPEVLPKRKSTVRIRAGLMDQTSSTKLMTLLIGCVRPSNASRQTPAGHYFAALAERIPVT